MADTVNFFLFKYGKAFFIVSFLLIICLQLPPTVSLFTGLIGVIVFGNPYTRQTKTITKYLLQASVIGLGFGMNFAKVVEAGRDGFVFTILTIGVAIGMGFMIGKL